MTQPVDAALAGEWADALIHGRRTVLPKRLAAPGPTPRSCSASWAPRRRPLTTAN
ncbi:hypothetical protein [Ramlibacter montanisoli]|uniref:hypothetical protein n=1 Tax=Ramlibacter montanisoli TaxID=2732512 RepID=UPI002815133B|nr:hypothetical protein [Ramlibacter montanisoli]